MPGLIGAEETVHKGQQGVVLTYDLTAVSTNAASFRARNATRGRFPVAIPGIEVISTEELGSSAPGRPKSVRVKVFVPINNRGVRDKVSSALTAD